MTIYNVLASIISGILGSMGLGGGGVLVLYLTLVLNMNQIQAQGINLLFFLPCAIISIIIQAKKKMIDYKSVIPIIIGGLPGILIGSLLIIKIETNILSKLFAVFLLFLGIRELLTKTKKAPDN